MNLLDRFINIPVDATYDQMKDYRVTVPDNFNFAYNVVDVYARECPDKKALVWCDDNDGDETFTFREISQWSKRAANFFVSKGIKKGDRVMYDKYSGTQVKIDGDEYLICKMSDIIAVLEK